MIFKNKKEFLNMAFTNYSMKCLLCSSSNKLKKSNLILRIEADKYDSNNLTMGIIFKNDNKLYWPMFKCSICDHLNSFNQLSQHHRKGYFKSKKE